ncbi:cell wall-binding repeat-containing protein [Ornithinibacillus halophilus]|nr:cell wall-binding repeat-containing protein [Ornithinibacillus halophilus]
MYKYAFSILILSMIVFLTPLTLFADETKHKLSDTKELIINNGVESSIKITESGKATFQKSLTLVKIADVQMIEVNNEKLVVVTYRHDGSSNALFFELLRLGDEEVKSLFTSETYDRGHLEINNHTIEVRYPIYENGAVKTDPTKLVLETFNLSETGVVETDTQLKDIEKPRFSLFKMASDNENLPYHEVNEMLTEEAIAANVSPEIVKAIAYQESGWQHYWETVPETVQNCSNYDGTNVKLGYDCIGIGIMQISDQIYMDEGPEKEEYIERLKTDIRFNIQEGIRILKEKWNYSKAGLIPEINDNDPMVIENWYFAIMAYNGLLPRNNPLEKPFSPNGAYQEEVLERIQDFTLLDIHPFPTHLLDPYEENGRLKFHTTNFQIDGPFNYSSQLLEEGDISYVTENGLHLRDAPGGNVIGSLNKGTKVTITGSFVGTNSRFNQYVWLPIETDSGQAGYVASSYLSPLQNYMKKYRLSGSRRYETSVSISNFGWHWDQPSTVVIGRGDLPIDALTGSVLASGLDSPLLLTQNNTLTDSVKKEITRLNPSKVYILGGSAAISPEVEDSLGQLVGESNVERISGTNRYETASIIGNQVSDITDDMDEVFVTTGDENSSDALAIAPYAGENNIPILLTKKNKLNQHVIDFIQENNISKVTIIGGTNAVSDAVLGELDSLVDSIERISGSTRYTTATEIVERYYDLNKISRIFFAQGMQIVDALSGSPLATKLNSPILLTKNNTIPAEMKKWLRDNVATKPNLYLLGGTSAVSNNVASQLIDILK